jgi:hypothetical protein
MKQRLGRVRGGNESEQLSNVAMMHMGCDMLV